MATKSDRLNMAAQIASGLAANPELYNESISGDALVKTIASTAISIADKIIERIDSTTAPTKKNVR